MRIIGGALKGRRIQAAKGVVSRPTTDRTRESLFNILSAYPEFQFEDARVIDLFAGSGALGFEAHSRGASWVLFVETDAAARGAIRDNIEALGLFGSTRIHRRSASDLGRKPASAGEAYDIAFLDPPYQKNLWQPALEQLRKGEWLKPGALTVVEQDKAEETASDRAFEQFDHRVYGDTQLSFFVFRPVRQTQA